jgi:simple sugar transport system substrate-binding protein
MVEKGGQADYRQFRRHERRTRQAAVQHPDIHFLHISGDDVLTGKAPKNLSNLMAGWNTAK